MTYDIIKEAFEKTKIARKYILEEVMLKQIQAPRDNISKYAPHIIKTVINIDKIKDVIGPGGKMINKIISQTGVKVDIEEDGRVFIYSKEDEAGKKALKMIEDIGKDLEIGEIYEGTVIKIMNFGAFIDLGGAKEGLLHISKISNKRVEKVEDVLKLGQTIKVKVQDIDEQGKISLNMKDLEEKE